MFYRNIFIAVLLCKTLCLGKHFVGFGRNIHFVRFSAAARYLGQAVNHFVKAGNQTVAVNPRF